MGKPHYDLPSQNVKLCTFTNKIEKVDSFT